MNDKPLVGLTLIFILGICLAKLLHIPFFYLYPLTLAVAILSFIFLRRTTFHFYLIILLLALTLTSLFLSQDQFLHLRGGGKEMEEFLKFFSPLSQGIENILDQTIDKPDNLALIKGLILGKRELISQDILEAFKNTGTFHILAISGLHIGLVGSIFFFFFQLLRLSQKFSALLAIPLIILYALIVLSNSLQPPVIRATLMMVCFLIGIILERERELLNILSFAALSILIFNPLLLFQAGFQLSFLAVLTLILFTPRIAGWMQKILPNFNKGLVNFFASLIAVQIGLLPILAFYYNLITPVAILANLLVIPLLSLILKVSFWAIFSGLVYLPVAKTFNAVNNLLLSTLIWLVKAVAQLPWAWQSVYTPSPLTIFGYYVFVLGIFFHQELKKIKINLKKIFLIVLLGLNLFVWIQVIPIKEDFLQVSFIDVGQGDSILVQFSRGGNLLIDGGKIGAGQRILKPYLWKKGIKKIDIMLLTHPDADHIGGLIPILKGFRIGKVLEPGLIHTSYLYQEFLELIDKKNIPYELVSQGDEIKGIYGTEIKVLNPPHPIIKERGYLNDNSVVLIIQYGKMKFLFSADILVEGQRRIMAQNPDLRVEVLKVPHHGGRENACQEFLELVKPEMAVISSGRDNPYGHPHPETLALYEKLGIRIYRTDRDGTVVVRSNGEKFWVKIERVPNLR